MKTQTLKIAAVFGLMIVSTLVFAQSSVNVNSVDNYAGNSNVYTDAPNAEVTITELDADKKPVRSWTGKTDDKGKITIPAGHNLSQPYLRAALANNKLPSYVLPSSLEQGIPFSFAAMGTVEGEVVSIQKENGEVVARQKTDHKGRIFLATGLGVGLYNLICGNGKSQRVGQIEVKPHPQDALSRPGQNLPMPMQVQPISSSSRISDMIRLSGQGINPDPASLQAFFKSTQAGAGQSAAIPQWLQDLLDGKYLIKHMDVLAATPNEIVLDPMRNAGIAAGSHGSIVVGNRVSRQIAETNNTFAYDARSRLVRTVVPSGAATQLEVHVVPEDMNADVIANIVSGPVTFANGQKEMKAQLDRGKAVFPINSNPGSRGHFQLQWMVQPSSHSYAPTNGIELPIMNLADIKPAGSRKRGHTIGGGTANPGGWTDEYVDYDENGNPIGRSSETYDANGRLRERKTTRNGPKDGDRTTQTETYDADGKWTGTKTETFEGGKQTGGTQTEPDGKGGKTTKTWDRDTGSYK